MKRLTLYQLYILPIIGLCLFSCNAENENEYGNKTIHFSFEAIQADISASSASTTRAQLSVNSTVRILVYKRSGSLNNISSDTYVDENTYVIGNDGSLKACLTDETGTKTSDNGTDMVLLSGCYDFYAISPAISVTRTEGASLHVSHGVDYATSLTGAVNVNSETGMQNVMLTTLDRKCSKITFNIDRGASSITNVSVNSLTLTSMSSGPLMAIPAQDLPMASTNETVLSLLNTDFKMGSNPWQASASAIVLPKSDGAMELSMNVNFNGHTAARNLGPVPLPSTTFEKGKEYLYTLKLYGDEIVVELSISPWYEVDLSTGDLGANTMPTSNCYIVAPGSSVEIPVSQANESVFPIEGATLAANGKYLQIFSATQWKASVLWQTAPDLISIDENTMSGVGHLSHFTVNANNTSVHGNAVVVIKDASDSVLWSWHIWVTDYKPNSTDTEHTTISNGRRDYIFMDRNLGATSATPGDIGTVGLLYQWGRKDPFPNRSDWSGTLTSLYGEINQIQKTTTTGITQAIRHPELVINSSITKDWSVSGNYYLWNSELGKKTAFDPCPQGWRVPVDSYDGGQCYPWEKLVVAQGQFLYADEGYGGVYENYGYRFTKSGSSIGYYPINGYMSGTKIFGNGGSYWSAYPYYSNQANLGTAFNFMNGYGGVGGSNRDIACGIRCVKE